MDGRFQRFNSEGTFMGLMWVRGEEALKILLRSLTTKTHLYTSDPLKPQFYTVKLGFTGVYIIFLIYDQKHRLRELVRADLVRRF